MTGGNGAIPADTIHLRRTLLLDDGTLVERLEASNFGRNPVQFDVSYTLAADFADVFEARGMVRQERGNLHQPTANEGVVRITYDGLDGVPRETLVFVDPPAKACQQGFTLQFALEPGAARAYEIAVRCSQNRERAAIRDVPILLSNRRAALEDIRQESASITTSNRLFNAWIERSRSDLEMLTIQTEHGPYPAAGAPWYVTPFGRDGIITALQMINLDPRLAAGVLRYLAAHQATGSDRESDAAPGKIVHEMREGEMAALGEHRFGRYYGAIDATPLFLMLAGAYFRRTADLNLIRETWPNILAAIDWIDNHGDLDGDGFVEYRSNTSGGLAQQGWKDSHDSVSHADGNQARGPIALCEVQGYVYQGLISVAEIAGALGYEEQASNLRDRAERLRRDFVRAFWDDGLGSFVLALDGNKQPCRIVTTNAGHCLYAGIAGPDHAARLAETFRGPDMASGWGLRTLSRAAAAFNPLSYHNGSVWPHDNAIVAAGLASYGFKDDALSMLNATFDAATRTHGMRLPELYCGFKRMPGTDPVRYPISCTPQAWAAGSVFILVSAALGLQIDARTTTLTLSQPRLPADIDWLRIDRLRVCGNLVNLTVLAHGDAIDADLEGAGVTLDVSS